MTLSLSPRDFWQYRQHQDPILIDVRSGLEYASGHAPGAHNLSLDRLLLGTIPFLRWLWPRWFRSLSMDHPIAVICLTSHRSPIAAQALTQVGFTQVFNISGGMLSWTREGLETCRGWSHAPMS